MSEKVSRKSYDYPSNNKNIGRMLQFSSSQLETAKNKINPELSSFKLPTKKQSFKLPSLRI